MTLGTGWSDKSEFGQRKRTRPSPPLLGLAGHVLQVVLRCLLSVPTQHGSMICCWSSCGDHRRCSAQRFMSGTKDERETRNQFTMTKHTTRGCSTSSPESNILNTCSLCVCHRPHTDATTPTGHTGGILLLFNMLREIDP